MAERLADVGLEGRLEVWFARILRDGLAASAAGAFAVFPELARHHLAVLLDEHGQAAADDRVDHIIDGFTQVTAHDDVGTRSATAARRRRHRDDDDERHRGDHQGLPSTAKDWMGWSMRHTT